MLKHYFGFAVAAAALCIGTADAQSLVTRKDLTLGMAKAIAEATMAECESKGYHGAAVVVDRSGEVLIQMRDERASKQTGELARRKAYTAAMYRRTTLEWVQRMHDMPELLEQRNQKDVIALGGGVPIKIGEDTLGAIGSAGGTTMLDDACAKAGVAKVANLLK